MTGATASFDFPLRDPVQASCADSLYCRDAFVAKLSPDGSELSYSTYLGGSSWESGTGIAIAPGGHAWVTGMTASADFPTVNPFQPTFGGDVDAFVSRISTPTTSLPDCSRATASPAVVSGASCTGEVTVCVPHDRGQGGSACVDSLARK